MDPKKDAKWVRKMVSKWSQDFEKESPELILDAMKASAKKKCSKKVKAKSPRRPGKAREPGLGALNKGKT